MTNHAMMVQAHSQCGGPGVRPPSAPPINFPLVNHLQETDKLEPKIIWRDIDVARRLFFANLLSSLRPVRTKPNENNGST